MRHKHTVPLACACVLVALACAATLRADPGPNPPTTTTGTTTTSVEAPAPDLDLIERLIQRQRQEAWRWERIMGLRLTHTLPKAPADPHLRAAAWHRLALTLRRRAQKVPHRAAWLCIHRFEGSWTDPSPPYYGGLQMDLQFQRRYGGNLPTREG